MIIISHGSILLIIIPIPIPISRLCQCSFVLNLVGIVVVVWVVGGLFAFV